MQRYSDSNMLAARKDTDVHLPQAGHCRDYSLYPPWLLQHIGAAMRLALKDPCQCAEFVLTSGGCATTGEHWPRQPPVVGDEVGTAKDAEEAAKDWRIRGYGCMPSGPPSCASIAEEFSTRDSREQ